METPPNMGVCVRINNEQNRDTKLIVTLFNWLKVIVFIFSQWFFFGYVFSFCFTLLFRIQKRPSVQTENLFRKVKKVSLKKKVHLFVRVVFYTRMRLTSNITERIWSESAREWEKREGQSTNRDKSQQANHNSVFNRKVYFQLFTEGTFATVA